MDAVVAWLKRGGWYFVVPVLSLGILTAIPFWHAHSRLGRPQLRQQAVVFTVAGAVLLILRSLTDSSALDGLVTFLGLACAGFGCYLLRPLLAEVTGAEAARAQGIGLAFDPAVQAVAQRRQRRLEVRDLARRDPAMARELGVGRPDRSRAFDDGGLVDLNRVDGPALSAALGNHELAGRVVAARQTWGCDFVDLDDACHKVDAPWEQQQVLRERGIVIPG